MAIWRETQSFSSYLERVSDVQNSLSVEKWNKAADILVKAWEQEKRVFTAGNGGSSSLAQHFATDWTKGLMVSCGKPLTTTSLNDNMALFSASANDFCYEEVFRKQLEIHKPIGGVLVAISSSGGSENILNAARFAKENSMDVIALTGEQGHQLLALSDFHVVVPTSNIQIIEDVHSMFGHFVLEMIYSRALKFRDE